LKTSTKVAIIVFFILLLDQILKIWVKTSMIYGDEINIAGDWFKLHFLENDGMAFGIRFHEFPILKNFLDEKSAKVLLSVFRIAAVGFIINLLKSMIKSAKSTKLTIYSMAFILAGAIGNIIDSIFYGRLFSESDPFLKNYAEFLPEGGGYAGLFHGKVVDMLYFPIVKGGTWPSWVPKLGGQPFEFFRPVFNIADSAISLGVLMLIISIFFIKPKADVNEMPVDSGLE